MLYKSYNQTRVAIIDAFSTGQLLAPAFRSRGINVVHIKNSLGGDAPHNELFHMADFENTISYTGDREELTKWLRSHNVEHVVPGTESGCGVVDEISRSLGSKTANRLFTADVRRDKRFMHQHLHRAGVPVPWQRHLDGERNLLWETSGSCPAKFVVKPAASSGSDGVIHCSDSNSVESAIDRLLLNENYYRQKNIGVVIQEALDGPEFAVNTSSADGFHMFIEVWRSDKIVVGGHSIYDKQVLLDPSDSDAERIRSYVSKVLDALGIRFGSSHTELILTKSGPLLLETTPRLPGGVDPSIGLKALGRSHLDEVVDSYLVPEVVARRGKTRALQCGVIGVSMIANRSGSPIVSPDFSKITSLRSYHGMRHSMGRGSNIQKTIDLATKPGGIYLCHPDQGQLQEDYLAIREWEREFYLNLG